MQLYNVNVLKGDDYSLRKCQALPQQCKISNGMELDNIWL
jgi:hypothetical protein